MAKQTKGRQIIGNATVLGMGSGCVGNMAWETPIVRFALNGERFTWQSDIADQYCFHVGSLVALTAFVRTDADGDETGRLYRVKILCVNPPL